MYGIVFSINALSFGAFPILPLVFFDGVMGYWVICADVRMGCEEVRETSALQSRPRTIPRGKEGRAAPASPSLRTILLRVRDA